MTSDPRFITGDIAAPSLEGMRIRHSFGTTGLIGCMLPPTGALLKRKKGAWQVMNRSRRVIATLAVVVALVSGMIWAVTPSRVAIWRVYLDRETTLQATGTANSCLGWLSVAVRETSNEVRVTVRDLKPRIIKLLGGGACLDGFAFTLTDPLGDRVLVDGATGQPVPIFPPLG